MYYIYKFFNKDNKPLYVGKTINLKSRFASHFSEDNWKKKEVSKIEFAICKCKTDMDIYELYYINKLKPRYNIASVNLDTPSINLEDLNFNIYTDYHKDSPTSVKKPTHKEKLFQNKCKSGSIYKINKGDGVKELIDNMHKYSYYNIEDKIIFKITCEKEQLNYDYFQKGEIITIDRQSVSTDAMDLHKNNTIRFECESIRGRSVFSLGVGSISWDDEIMQLKIVNPEWIVPKQIFNYIDFTEISA